MIADVNDRIELIKDTRKLFVEYIRGRSKQFQEEAGKLENMNVMGLLSAGAASLELIADEIESAVIEQKPGEILPPACRGRRRPEGRNDD